MKYAGRFEQFPPYTPIEPLDVLSNRLGIPLENIVKLDANENPFGPSPAAREALAQMQWAHIYPDPESRELRAGLSDFLGVPAANLMAGAGADELIDLLLRVLLEKDDIVLNFQPTFGMYAFNTRLNNGSLIELPREEDFSISFNQLEQAVKTHNPKVVFLTNPNNPSGNLIPSRDLKKMLELPTIFVVDEAYIEFVKDDGLLGSETSLIKAVPQRENLIVLRTFSKWAGLAGLRVGYGAFPDWLMPVLWKVKQPYNVNAAAQAAAVASLQDRKILSERVEKIKQERERLFLSLKEISWLDVYPSQANFLLCKVLKGNAGEIRSELMQKGIMVRYYDNAWLDRFLRFSIGLPEQTDKLLAALKEISPQL